MNEFRLSKFVNKTRQCIMSHKQLESPVNIGMVVDNFILLQTGQTLQRFNKNLKVIKPLNNSVNIRRKHNQCSQIHS